MTAVLISCSLTSCIETQPHNLDPDESLNRKVHSINDVLDSLILRPATITYTHVVPHFMQEGIHNVFNNLDSVEDISNDILQGKGAFALSDSGRMLINSTMGIGGTIDVAKGFGLPPHEEDFGLTLAQWGAKYSAFSESPFFGPSTYRDTFALPFDWFIFSAWPYIKPKKVYYSLLVTWVLDKRAQLLPADQLIQQSFDPYIFVRNAYISMRNQEIKDNGLSYREYKRNYEQQKNLNQDTGVEVSADHSQKATTITAPPADESGVITVG